MEVKKEEATILPKSDKPPRPHQCIGTSSITATTIALPKLFILENSSQNAPNLSPHPNIPQLKTGNLSGVLDLPSNVKLPIPRLSKTRNYSGSRQSRTTTILQQVFPCAVCNMGFLSQEKLLVHQKIHLASLSSSSIDLVEDKKADINVNIFSQSTSLESLKNDEFERKSMGLKQIIRQDGKIFVKLSDLSESLPVKVQPPIPRLRHCPFCNKIFTHANVFFAHVDEHRVKPYQCSICQRIFTKQDDYTTHLQTHIEERYSCHHCGKTFSKQRLFQVHIQKHIPQKNQQHNCKACRQKFSSATDLRTHMQNKKCKSKLSKCKFCGKIYLKHTIKDHENIHKDVAFSCTVCDKSFKTESALKKHKSRHDKIDKRFPCQACGKVFAQRRTLIYHERIHTGEKPYPCPICDKEFRGQDKLKKHMEIHLKAKHYVCTACGKTFERKVDLEAHLHLHDDDLLNLKVTDVKTVTEDDELFDLKDVTEENVMKTVKEENDELFDLSIVKVEYDESY